MSAAAQNQRIRALTGANSVRRERKEIREALAAGALSLTDVLAALPPALDRMTAFELIGWERAIGMRKLAAINRAAMEDGVNLALPLSMMNERMRRWLLWNLGHTRAYTPVQSRDGSNHTQQTY